jgi:hypothetical protein
MKMKIRKVYFNIQIDFFKAHNFRGFKKKSLTYGGMNLEMKKCVNFNII